MKSIKDNYILILYFVVINLLYSCVTSYNYRRSEEYYKKYVEDVHKMEENLEEQKIDYIKYEFSVSNQTSSVTNVSYFIYKKDNSYLYLKISGLYRYQPRAIHYTNWNKYINILRDLKQYDCGNDSSVTPESTKPVFNEITISVGGVKTKSLFYYYQVLTIEDGSYSNDNLRVVESKFLHQFVMDIHQYEMRDMNIPTPVSP